LNQKQPFEKRLDQKQPFEKRLDQKQNKNIAISFGATFLKGWGLIELGYHFAEKLYHSTLIDLRFVALFSKVFPIIFTLTGIYLDYDLLTD
jgi:hypothetical protein